MNATLARRLVIEDRAGVVGFMAPDDRLTCQRCTPGGSPSDELARDVIMRCQRCGEGGSTATIRPIVACRKSLEAAVVEAGDQPARCVHMTFGALQLDLRSPVEHGSTDCRTDAWRKS